MIGRDFWKVDKLAGLFVLVVRDQLKGPMKMKKQKIRRPRAMKKVTSLFASLALMS